MMLRGEVMVDLLDTIIHSDCFNILPTIPDHSVDMILCDLPYGKTAAKWDIILPMDKLWAEYKRLIKPRGAIVLTAVQPFTSLLVTSNLKWYRHSWVWDKVWVSGFQTAKVRPMQQHEDIVVFGRDSTYYSPQMEILDKSYSSHGAKTSHLYGDGLYQTSHLRTYTHRYPASILRIRKDRQDHFHPTQKPVALFEYLIKTYTREGDTVLDHCSGSGTTSIAAYLTNRHFICIEKDAEYHRKSVERLQRERRKIRSWAFPELASA